MSQGTGPTLASSPAEVLPSPPTPAQPTALHELELNLVIYPVFLFVSPWVRSQLSVCAFWLSRTVTSWRHPHSSLSNIYKEEMSRHNSVNRMTWRNEVRTMGSSLIVAVCACQPSSPPASIWSEDFKYFPSQTIIISFQRLHQNRGTSWSPGSWCLFLIPVGFYSLSRKRDQTVVTATRHKRNLKIVARWRTAVVWWCCGGY